MTIQSIRVRSLDEFRNVVIIDCAAGVRDAVTAS